jgi:hypothetical protein
MTRVGSRGTQVKHRWMTKRTGERAHGLLRDSRAFKYMNHPESP